jgi:hypothetical protein
MSDIVICSVDWEYEIKEILDQLLIIYTHLNFQEMCADAVC